MQRKHALIGLITLAGLGFTPDNSTTTYHFPELKLFPKIPVAESNPVTNEGVALGRYLFYDPVLSADSNMSCSSCHKQQFAFSDSPNKLSMGREGVLMKRNTIPLFNLAWYSSFFWDGRSGTIEDQVFHPVREINEMNLQWNVAVKRLEENGFYSEKFRQVFGSVQIDSVHVTKAIAQFLRILISYRSRYDKVLNGEMKFNENEYEGFVMVNDQSKADCIHCHNTDGSVLATSLLFSNNGLEKISDPEKYPDKGRGGVTGIPSDNGKFKVPSLRNLVFTSPYMHDGRFKTLEEVIDFYSEGVNQSANVDSKMEFAHKGGAALSAEEKKKIIAFLVTLSDSAFISDTLFGNPFIR